LTLFSDPNYYPKQYFILKVFSAAFAENWALALLLQPTDLQTRAIFPKNTSEIRPFPESAFVCLLILGELMGEVREMACRVCKERSTAETR